MTYCDAVYLALFLPLTILIYSIMPKKHRAKVLLLASYIFFWSISRKLIVYVWASTLSIFGFGKWLEAVQNKRNEVLKNDNLELVRDAFKTYTLNMANYNK